MMQQQICHGQFEVLGTTMNRAKSLSSQKMLPSGGEDPWELRLQEASAMEGRRSAVGKGLLLCRGARRRPHGEGAWELSPEEVIPSSMGVGKDNFEQVQRPEGRNVLGVFNE